MDQRLTKDERSLGDLFSELANETGTLVRQEVSLAQVEMTQKAARVGKQVGFLAVGGAIGYAALLAVMAGIILVLTSLGVPAWLSAILVGAVVAGVSYYLVTSALEKLKHTEIA